MDSEKKFDRRKGISLKIIGWVTTLIASIVSAVLVISLINLGTTYHKVTSTTAEYMAWKDTAMGLSNGSDELTNQVRSYVVTGQVKYRDGYFTEAASGRREKAVETIKNYLEETTVYNDLQEALNASIDLMNSEYYAMRLMVVWSNEDMAGVPEEVKKVVLSEEDEALIATAQSDPSKWEGIKDRAEGIVYGDAYANSKTKILGNVDKAVSTLDGMLQNSVLEASSQMKIIIVFQSVFIGINIFFVAGSILLMYIYLLRPIQDAVTRLNNDEAVEIRSVKEYRFLAWTYNKIREQNKHHKESLLYQAEHDKLTGLLNRTGYDDVFQKIDLNHVLFILLDVDKFKDVNDEYGHAAGDKVLKRVSDTMLFYFHDDNCHVFRIGGDEFAIIMEGIQEDRVAEMVERCKHMNTELKGGTQQLRISLSIGVALGNDLDTTDTLFKKADLALYHTKNTGRGKVALFDESMR
ncbi:MAG: GGDEF domain-containing protein [Bacilli bacterium]|nr:GGDEF domain-containing protein [Bacilli bacterium]